jgi:hypothetical protein
MNFESRLNKLIIVTIRDEKGDYDHDVLHLTRALIKGRSTQTCMVLGEKEHGLIDLVRNDFLCLKDDEQIWDDWAKRRTDKWNVRGLLRMYSYLRSLLSEEDRTFSLAPIHSFERRNIKIDAVLLCNVMKRAGLYDGKDDDFRKDFDAIFNRIFKVKRRPGFVPTGTIDTDGISVCFHYRRTIRDVPTTSTKKTKKPKTERQWCDAGVDTGLVNQIYAVRENEDGSFDRFVFRKRRYYAESGINKNTQRTTSWCGDIQKEIDLLKTATPKTKSTEQLSQYVAVVASVFDRLWEYKFKRKWARAKLRVFGGKNRSLDRFFADLRKKLGPEAVLQWGDADVRSSMRGTKSAPTTKQLYRARLQFRVNPVDEYGSSKACHCCENVICAVRRVTDDKGKKSTREIRGLRYCSNSRKFYDRDFNAAVNILRFGATGERPVTMVRRDASSESNDGEKSVKITQKTFWMKQVSSLDYQAVNEAS